MNAGSLFRLVTLSAIWGASFLFLRMGAPILGPTLLIECRAGLAAIFLCVVGALIKKRLNVRQNWKQYVVLGTLNTAVPHLLFAIAAKSLSASLLSILNATAPIWGAVIAALWTRTALSARAGLGLMLGVGGVAILVGFDEVTLQAGGHWAILCMLGAACSYSIGTTYAKTVRMVDPFANAHGSMWVATLLIAPAVPFFPAVETPNATVVAAVITLGVLCTGVAQVLYFRLIADIGVAPALTVTFLIPVFGIIFGAVFLNEPVGWHTFVGAIVVIVGTALVTDFSLAALFPKRVASER